MNNNMNIELLLELCYSECADAYVCLKCSDVKGKIKEYNTKKKFMRHLKTKMHNKEDCENSVRNSETPNIIDLYEKLSAYPIQVLEDYYNIHWKIRRYFYYMDDDDNLPASRDFYLGDTKEEDYKELVPRIMATRPIWRLGGTDDYKNALIDKIKRKRMKKIEEMVLANRSMCLDIAKIVCEYIGTDEE